MKISSIMNLNLKLSWVGDEKKFYHEPKFEAQLGWG